MQVNEARRKSNEEENEDEDEDSNNNDDIRIGIQNNKDKLREVEN